MIAKLNGVVRVKVSAIESDNGVWRRGEITFLSSCRKGVVASRALGGDAADPSKIHSAFTGPVALAERIASLHRTCLGTTYGRSLLTPQSSLRPSCSYNLIVATPPSHDELSQQAQNPSARRDRTVRHPCASKTDRFSELSFRFATH